MIALPPRRVRLVKAEIRPSSATECVARVELQRDDATSYIGTQTGSSPQPEALRAAAEAAAKALVEAAGPEEHELEIKGLELMQVFGRSGVIVHLLARRKGTRQALMGFSVAETDPTQAAALAVLNATNRFFGVG